MAKIFSLFAVKSDPSPGRGRGGGIFHVRIGEEKLDNAVESLHVVNRYLYRNFPCDLNGVFR